MAGEKFSFLNKGNYVHQIGIIRIYNMRMSSSKTITRNSDNPVGNRPTDGAREHVVSRAGSRDSVRRVASRTLLSGDREIEIEHNGALYRLRQTSMGKLILTK